MLRKTTFITILIYEYNSMYTISCVIGVRPVHVTNDHRPGEHRTGGGGGVPNIEDSTSYFFVSVKGGRSCKFQHSVIVCLYL